MVLTVGAERYVGDLEELEDLYMHHFLPLIGLRTLYLYHLIDRMLWVKAGWWRC